MTMFDHSSGSANKGIAPLLDPEPLVHANGDREYRRLDKKAKKSAEPGQVEKGNWLDSRGTALGIFAAVAALALIGFANSFAAIQEAARPSFGGMAWTLPLAVDLGVLVFAVLDLFLARRGMRMRWVRLIPWALTGITIYLNVATEDTLFGTVAHAVLPSIWVIAVEIGAAVARRDAGIEQGTHRDPIRVSRWFLAPLSTATLWRRSILWEERSYTGALAKERDRQYHLCDLTEQHGRFWRLTAPRRARVAYRLGDRPVLADVVDTKPDAGPDMDPEPTKVRADRLDTNTVIKADMLPAIEADTKPDSDMKVPVAKSDTDTKPDSDTKVATVTSMSGRNARKAEALKLMTANPDITAKELAVELGVTDRQARRYMAKPA